MELRVLGTEEHLIRLCTQRQESAFLRLFSRKMQLKECRSGMNDAENGSGGRKGSTMAE
jgi:hypothetical protein